MTKVVNNNKRIYYIDVLRVIACLSVIMVHSSANYVIKDFGSTNFWIGNILDSISRICVPLFIMISGALLLDEKYMYSKEKNKHHIKKMIIFFIFWSFLYCLIFQIIGQVLIEHKPIDIANVFLSFIQGHYHLWFVYLIIGLYLILPLLRLWVNANNKKQIEYFIILSIVFTYIIPQIISIGSNYSDYFLNLKDIIENKLCIKYIGGFTTYFILGWYLNNYEIKHKNKLYILGIIGLLITIIGTYIISISTGKEAQMYGNLSLNVLLQTLMVFIIVKTKFKNSDRNNKLVMAISNNSLGIYAIHALVATILNRIIVKIGFQNALINIPIVFIGTFIISFILSYFLSKIPVLKRII